MCQTLLSVLRIRQRSLAGQHKSINTSMIIMQIMSSWISRWTMGCYRSIWHLRTIRATWATISLQTSIIIEVTEREIFRLHAIHCCLTDLKILADSVNRIRMIRNYLIARSYAFSPIFLLIVVNALHLCLASV